METTAPAAPRISSYSDIFTMGHKALAELFSSPVIVEEKIDGSQISFAKIGGELHMRSKGKQLVVLSPEKMFALGVEAVAQVFHLMPEGYTFRGEYLQSEKHNTLKYDRIPKAHIIIFDVDKGNQDYASPAEKYALAAQLGFETVPHLFSGRIESVEQIKALLPATSVLGGAQPEGIVIKNYTRFGPDKKILMGKYVRPEFQEAHAVEWKKTNPVASDIIDTLIKAHKTDARWEKAVQHLRDAGALTQEPKDIAALLAEVEADVERECAQAIKDALWRWAWPKIARGVKAGLPEWYKNKLLEGAIEGAR